MTYISSTLSESKCVQKDNLCHSISLFSIFHRAGRGRVRQHANAAPSAANKHTNHHHRHHHHHHHHHHNRSPVGYSGKSKERGKRGKGETCCSPSFTCRCRVVYYCCVLYCRGISSSIWRIDSTLIAIAFMYISCEFIAHTLPQMWQGPVRLRLTLASIITHWFAWWAPTSTPSIRFAPPPPLSLFLSLSLNTHTFHCGNINQSINHHHSSLWRFHRSNLNTTKNYYHDGVIHKIYVKKHTTLKLYHKYDPGHILNQHSR